jgi:hypothetical protein
MLASDVALGETNVLRKGTPLTLMLTTAKYGIVTFPLVPMGRIMEIQLRTKREQLRL